MKTIIVLFGAFLAASVHAEMTGSVKDNYLREHAKSCYASQRSNYFNSGEPDQYLRDYCACVGRLNSFALSNDDVLQIEAGRKSPDLYIAVMNNSANYCRENVARR